MQPLLKGNTVVKSPGALTSRSRGRIFLRRRGNHWEVTSDHILYEQAAIRFGKTKELDISLVAPDQAFSGEPYSARLLAEIPKGMMVVASIAKTPFVFPQLKPNDSFRTMSSETPALERVFDANERDYNEFVTATVGLTEIGQDQNDRPQVTFHGLITLTKRVNVLPKIEPHADGQIEAQVQTSANNLIDLRRKPSDASEAVTP